MKGPTVERNLFLYFLLVMTALVANNYALLSNIRDLNEHEQLVNQSYEVIGEIDAIESALAHAEAVARGYMMAPREEDFMSQLSQKTKDVWLHVDEVQKLTAENTGQQEALKKLRSLIDVRLEKLHENFRALRSGVQADFFAKYVIAGKKTMDELKNHLSTMEGVERRLLEKRGLEAARSYQLVIWTFFISALVNFLLAIAAYWLVRRQMTNQAKTLMEQEHRNWIQSNLIRLGQAFSQSLSPKLVADECVKIFTQNLGFTAANFYVANEGYISRTATMGGPLAPRENTRFSLEEGLVGAALHRKDIHQISEIPEGYFQIESGLGVAAPRALVFVPLHFQGAAIGVIELASFNTLDSKLADLLPQVQERLAAILSTALANEKQADLLEETQRQAEELQAQQEELRTNNEELEEQAAALLRAQERQQTQQEELRQINEELEAQARSLEHQQEVVNLRNDELESARRESEIRAVELERTNQYKSEFLAKMSHELRTPLNSMLILSALLTEDKDRNLTDQQIEFARTIHDAGADLLNLINDILDLSKLEAGKLTLSPETFSLKAFLHQVELQFRPIMDKKGINFKVELGAGTPDTLRTDRQRVEQVLRNLLSNAAKFTERGEVRLDIQMVAGDASRIRFAVHDTGIGIPAEKKQRIFEAFEQVDGTISRRFGGTGLGLTISRELAVLLHGVLEVESQENVGSTFVLEIPCSVEAAAKVTSPLKKIEPVGATLTAREPVEKPIAPPKNVDHLLAKVKDTAKGRSLLIVEDDEGFTKALEESARSHGFQPLSVTDGELALEVLNQHVPSAILLDVKLPGISGMSVLENIKQNSKLRHIPIHMISAMDYQVPALRLGAIGYLDKPVTMDGVKGAFERIERMLDKHVKQVLVIEDDERQSRAMLELLKGPGVEITVAKSAREALEVINQLEFECVIVDLTLPDLSGIELLEKVHAALGEEAPPIIIYTGRELSRDEEQKLREFSESIIIKGAKSPERLLDEVNLFLHRVESELPEEQRSMLSELRMREKSFENRSVLLVDDDLRNIFALTSALESKGLKVVAARNGVEALEMLDKNPHVDAILMDIMMPKMDGFEAIKRIRQKPDFKELPIIALTAKAMKGDHERCLQAGANDYLPKPVNLMNLISVLKVWLVGKGMWM